MAEDNPSPITAAEPPKPEPIVGAAGSASTLRLKPVIRKPAGGAPSAAPAQTALRPGLKLPPKRVIGGARPGGLAPARPVLRPTVKPVEPVSAPAEPAAAPAVSNSVEQLKSITQSMKSITSPMPQQAILRRTGIIADTALTEAQKMAAKARTARISLSDAVGAAPVQDEGAPMKTIRIKRPGEIPGATASLTPEAHFDSAPTVAPETKTETATTVTQRKTLKIARPAGGVRPGGKFMTKKAAPAAVAKPSVASDDEVAEIEDIPDIPEIKAASAELERDTVADVPKAVGVIGLILQIAACGVMGALGWFLWQDTQLFHFCGGCMPWPPVL